jgi:hypothetical protein
MVAPAARAASPFFDAAAAAVVLPEFAVASAATTDVVDSLHVTTMSV